MKTGAWLLLFLILLPIDVFAEGKYAVVNESSDGTIWYNGRQYEISTYQKIQDAKMKQWAKDLSNCKKYIEEVRSKQL